MIVRVAFFILMALGLLGFGTVAWISTRPPAAQASAEPPPPTTKTVLVAAHEIRAGTLLKPEDLVGKEMAFSSPNAADGNIDQPDIRRGLVGSMVRVSLSVGDVVRNSDVMRPGDHGFLAAVLQPGMRAVTISVDNTSGSAGLIWPGDRVDLILTETIAESNLPIGRRVAAETVLSDVRVIAIDQQLVQGAAPGSTTPAKTVTLEVTEGQAERVSVATRLGGLSLSVRPADGSKSLAQARINGSTTWASDVSPALGIAPPPQSDNVVRVFQGGGEAKEFKF